MKKKLMLKRKIILLITFCVSSYSAELTKGQITNKIGRSLRGFKSQDLRKTLIDFVSCCKPNRSVFLSGNEQAFQFIKGQIEERDPFAEKNLSIHTFAPDIEKAKFLYQQDFKEVIEGKFEQNSKEYKKWNRFTQSMLTSLDSFKNKRFKNIIWEKKGKSKETLILFAHYDSIVHDQKTNLIMRDGKSQGANDNGTGVSFLLEMISLLSSYKTEKSLMVVFTNFQELGFLGTEALIKDIIKPRIKNSEMILFGAINILMIGRDTKFQDKTKKLFNYKIYGKNGSDKVADLAKLMDETSKDFRKGIKFEYLDNDFKYSDHIPFWENGMPAIVISHDWENDSAEAITHTQSDSVETLNMNSFHKVSSRIFAGIARILKPTE